MVIKPFGIENGQWGWYNGIPRVEQVKPDNGSIYKNRRCCVSFSTTSMAGSPACRDFNDDGNTSVNMLQLSTECYNVRSEGGGNGDDYGEDKYVSMSTAQRVMSSAVKLQD